MRRGEKEGRDGEERRDVSSSQGEKRFNGSVTSSRNQRRQFQKEEGVEEKPTAAHF